jgi:outer membrane protein, heavy metal efflux system
MELFGEYVGNAARGAAWLYGVSLDFLIRRPGDRARVRHYAQVQTAVAQADLAESIWRVRATLRQALLDAASARDEAALLDTLIAQRQALLVATRAQADVGEVARTETLAIEAELSHAKQRSSHAHARRADAEARLAAAVGLPVAALEGIPVQWEGWADIGALAVSAPADWRGEALIGRPEIVRAVHEYDLAESALQGEVAKRWPDLHLTPGYAWGRNGVRENPLNDLVRQNALSVTFEAPVFNFHEGPIGEALARREAAGEHLTAVQADLYGQIDRAERAWPGARRAWEHAAGAVTIAERRREAGERALAAGAADRISVLSAGVVATEAQLTLLEAACEAERAFGTLEDAYRRPLSGSATAPAPGVSPRR